jgi:hypothetical protein
MLSGGFRFSSRSVFSGHLELGQMTVQPATDRAPAYRGPFLDSQVTLRIGDAQSVELATHRSTMNSFYDSAVYTIWSMYQAGIRQALGRRFDVGLRFMYNDLHYPGLGGQSEVTRTHELSLGYNWKTARFSVFGQYWGRQSPFASFRGYDGWRFGVRLTTPRLVADPQGIFLNGIQM